MSITLKQLYSESKTKYKLKLLAGENVLDNVVSWFHFMEDESTIDFIRGNELIVTTGLGSKNDEWLDNLIKGLINRHTSGLMVNIGQYISKIPDYTIKFCNDNGFPLFTIPWEVHLVDIMQDYCNCIMNAEQHKSNICSAFFNAIFSPMQKDSYIPCLNQASYDLHGEFIILSLDLDSSIHEKNNEIKLKNFIMRIENTLNSFSFKYSLLTQNNQLNIITNFSASPNPLNYVDNYVISHLKNYSEIKHMGVSSSINSIENLHKAYTEASNAKYTSIKDDTFIIYYENMGIDKLLLNVNDMKILYDLYKKYLGSIHDYDKIHKTDYENILEIYLKNNCSIQAVSKKTYTHRNTINYRIKKIKEILNNDLDNSEENFNYLLAFHIREILNIKQNIKTFS
ncbi:PucR family transcriptional regulator [Clostridium butyricum]|uniref:PucR family transcriptional regulator n=1 Tax=Clostridium butyricum TaxID=1492 RepID=UPI00374E44D0